MKYKCLIFDLDGTLVNSIHALTYCTNLSLEKFGLGPLTEEQMMTSSAIGYKMQMKRSLRPAGIRMSALRGDPPCIYGDIRKIL